MTTIETTDRSHDQAGELPERIANLKDKLYSRHMQTDIERAMYYTRSYKSTEGQPPCMRAAMGLEETLRNMTIRIEDGERIVGSQSAKEWGSSMYLEANGLNVWAALAALLHGKPGAIKYVLPDGGLGLSADFLRDAPNLSDEEFQELTEEILPYWKANCTAVHKVARWKEEGIAPRFTVVPSLMGGKPGSDDEQGDMKDIFGSDGTSGTIDFHGHVTIGIKKVLDMGFKGIARQATEQLAKLRPNEDDYEERKDFLESVQVSAKAACEFGERYAKLAQEIAREADGQRKDELLQISERCHRVPAQPPRNFVEAVQAIWLTQAMVMIAYGDTSITCPGRVDQFLYPYYKQDLKKGLITRDEALEIIEEYYLKLATCIYFGPNNVTIGGLTKQGEDGTNEVSYLFLEAHTNLKGLRNGLAVRIDSKTPRDFLLKACEVHRVTAGVAFYNDDVVIRDLMGDGYSLADARDFSLVGCVETTGTGNNNGNTASNAIFPVAILETALYEGRRAATKWELIGLETPPASEFKTFEDVKKAYADQLAFVVDTLVKRGYSRDKVIAETYPIPLLSCTIEGCVESGRDISRGGARYNHGAIGAQALATVADSLTAIKWAVFDKNLLTMEELLEHLHNNFEGAEEVRRQLLSAPKFGNDDPYADEIAAWVADVISNTATSHEFWMGGRHRTCLISSLTQVPEGAGCEATPDGRLAGAPVSNGMSPSNGTDSNGMTAALRSAASVSGAPFSDGTSFNITFNPSVISTEDSLDKFASMIEGYFALGGRHVQFNPVSKETLLDAQVHPENYADLSVKVSGFSERFIDIPKDFQDDIIARTEHTAM
jgi:formate C-acetyltransferase